MKLCSLLNACARTVIRKQSLRSAILSTKKNGLNFHSKRSVKTISDVRQYLINIVGAKTSFSEESPNRANLQSYLVEDQSQLVPRLMQDSMQTVVIPLSDEAFRDKYMTIHHRIRFGQLLENLDSFAVLISYEHNQPMVAELGTLMEDLDILAGFISYTHCELAVLDTGISPLSIVTAMVDEIRIHTQDIDPTQDIVMKGNVTWSGRSSLEIGMWLTQNDMPILDAMFVMVARDAESKRSAVVHPLKPVTEEEKILFENGNKNKIRRLNEAKESLFQTSPTVEEKEIVHNLFLNTLDSSSKSFKGRHLPENSVWLESTKLKNAIVCFPQRRNIHNKIFGGYLMRKGYELAWANACVYSKSVPSCVAMDDIIFHCPVPIGSLLLMSSQISYVEKHLFTCRVHAEVLDPRTAESRTSNVFHFMFTCRDVETPSVVPKTYGESMLYLDGRRRLKQSTLLCQ